MNLRHPKTMRLGGWSAGVTTLLVVAAGAYLALHFIQAGDVLNGGLIAGVTAVSGLFGGLLSYCLFVFARMQPAQAEAPAVVQVEEEVAKAVSVEGTPVAETPADEDEAIAISVTKLASEAPPEFSDDEMPVFPPSTSPSMGDVDSDDFDPTLPPPIDAVDDSDSIAVERSVSADEFDSAMDLPVRIDALELNVEDMDVVPPVVQSQTTAVVSALTQTDEVDALDVPTASVTPEPLLPEPVAKKSLPDSFPDIFKTAPFKPSPIVSETPAAPATVPQKSAPAPVEKVAPVAVSKPVPLPKPPVKRPEPAAAPTDEESLPVVDDLSDIAITLGPVTPTGVLPTEIPDFFLKMPTGRSMPAAPKPVMPVMPVAPVAPRQVAPQKAVNHAAAAVKIIDSTTIAEAADDLVTMTAIPDDWPS
ncbi:hypothetical protein AYO47_04740 [Planctomyces sp. SCGC AG-212-M04]|nr:hypothetical protein AYO47_04740 [Planctomyces sp. SCGC AG-212-M04]